jgi:hypothetical protein
MAAKKTTTTKTVEKEIKNSADEVKATTSTKATASKTTKASTRKKMTKEELVKKAMEDAKAKKEAEKPVEEETTKATKATVKKPKTTKKPKAEEVKRQVLFLDSMSIKDFGDLQRVKTEDWEELKELFREGAVILTVWNKKTIRNYDGCTPGVKVNDLYAYDLSDRVYDVVTPIYTKSTSEQVIAISNYTEAAFIFYEFEVLNDAKYGEYRQSSDLVYEIYMPKKQQ